MISLVSCTSRQQHGCLASLLQTGSWPSRRVNGRTGSVHSWGYLCLPCWLSSPTIGSAPVVALMMLTHIMSTHVFTAIRPGPTTSSRIASGREREREVTRERESLIQEGNRAPVSNATHAREREEGDVMEFFFLHFYRAPLAKATLPWNSGGTLFVFFSQKERQGSFCQDPDGRGNSITGRQG